MKKNQCARVRCDRRLIFIIQSGILFMSAVISLSLVHPIFLFLSRPCSPIWLESVIHLPFLCLAFLLFCMLFLVCAFFVTLSLAPSLLLFHLLFRSVSFFHLLVLARSFACLFCLRVLSLAHSFPQLIRSLSRVVPCLVHVTHTREEKKTSKKICISNWDLWTRRVENKNHSQKTSLLAHKIARLSDCVNQR